MLKKLKFKHFLLFLNPEISPQKGNKKIKYEKIVKKRFCLYKNIYLNLFDKFIQKVLK